MILNVTSITAQMDCDAVGAGLFTRHRRGDNTRFGRTSRLAHSCDVIDIYV